MKKFVLAAALAAMCTTPSQAADIAARPYTKAPSAMPVVNWTGFYVGGGGGYGWWDADTFRAPGGGGVTPRANGDGSFATVSGGYDWQFSSWGLVGIFGDAQFGKIQGTIVDSTNSQTAPLKNDVNYAAGARIGFLITPNALIYANGGYSHANFKDSILTGNGLGPFPTSAFGMDGYFVGGGVETSLNIIGLNAPGWFVKAEYRYADYRTAVVPELGNPPIAISFTPVVQTVSGQLVYKFNLGR